MELRNGKRFLTAPPTRINRRKPRPSRLLDLPAELKLMIYGYVFGYKAVHWTMTFETIPKPGYILALGRVDFYNVIQRNRNLRRHRHRLLQTCRQISQEALPVFYNQTRFHIGFHQADIFKNSSAYRLRLTSGRIEMIDDLARVVFRRVNHVRFNFFKQHKNSSYLWHMRLLRALLGNGAWLKSLQAVVNGNMKFTSRAIPNFDSLEANVFYTKRQSLLL